MGWANILNFMPTFKVKCPASAHLEVKLNAKHNAQMSSNEVYQLYVMASLGTEFGLDRHIIFDMAESIFRSWSPYRA